MMYIENQLHITVREKILESNKWNFKSERHIYDIQIEEKQSTQLLLDCVNICGMEELLKGFVLIIYFS